MKRAILIVGLMAFMAMSFTAVRSTDENKDQMARVSKIDGIEVYLMSEPIKPYEVIDDLGSGLQFGSSLSTVTIDELTQHYVEAAKKVGKKKDKTVDAVIYTSGKKAVAVKWK
jgi:hypothetical protein